MAAPSPIVFSSSSGLSITYRPNLRYTVLYNQVSNALASATDIAADTGTYLSSAANFLLPEQAATANNAVKDIEHFVSAVGLVAQLSEEFKRSIESAIGLEWYPGAIVDVGYNKRANDYLAGIVSLVNEYYKIPEEDTSARNRLALVINKRLNAYNNAEIRAYTIIKDIDTEIQEPTNAIEADGIAAEVISTASDFIKEKDEGLLTFLRSASRDVAITQTPSVGAAITSLGNKATGDPRVDFFASELSTGTPAISAVIKRATQLDKDLGEDSYIVASATAIKEAILYIIGNSKGNTKVTVTSESTTLFTPFNIVNKEIVGQSTLSVVPDSTTIFGDQSFLNVTSNSTCTKYTYVPAKTVIENMINTNPISFMVAQLSRLLE